MCVAEQAPVPQRGQAVPEEAGTSRVWSMKGLAYDLLCDRREAVLGYHWA